MIDTWFKKLGYLSSPDQKYKLAKKGKLFLSGGKM